MDRIFTVAEANGLISRLRTILGEMTQEWGRIQQMQPEIQKARDKAVSNGYSAAGAGYVQAVSHLMSLIQQIEEMGVILKDVDKGLCDFPYMRNGRLVYLCWCLGEEAVEYWHEIETGFAGREPLDATDL
jgi:hypothetical protein